jgi:hypothetical protein
MFVYNTAKIWETALEEDTNLQENATKIFHEEEQKYLVNSKYWNDKWNIYTSREKFSCCLFRFFMYNPIPTKGQTLW